MQLCGVDANIMRDYFFDLKTGWLHSLSSGIIFLRSSVVSWLMSFIIEPKTVFEFEMQKIWISTYFTRRYSAIWVIR